MAQEVDQIVVGANGKLWVAPVATAVPADESAAPGAGWVDLGYTSEDGVTAVDSKTLEAIPVWQLFFPARRVITERDFSLAFALRQWSKDTVKLAFGGGTITTVSAGHFKFAPPAPEALDPRSMMLDWTDGTKKYRLVIVRGLVTENVETNIVRSAAADLPITFSILGDDSGESWYLLTNDPAFA